MTTRPPVDPLRSAREEMHRQYYAEAISLLSFALESGKLSKRQTERALLLRADAYSYERRHEKALADAQVALKVSNGTTPQPYFVVGREQLALFRITASMEAFQMAEVLMNSPPAEELDQSADPPSPSGKALADAWAKIGIDPQVAPTDCGPASPTGAPPSTATVVPTAEWIGDLQRWRACEEEAKALSSMLSTHLVARSVLNMSTALLVQKVQAIGSRCLVLVVKNDSPSNLTFEFDHFFSGQFLSGFAFPNTIASGEIGIAAVHSNAWGMGVKGVTAFSFFGHDGALIYFDNPFFGNFSCGVKCASLQHLEFNKSSSSGRALLHERASSSSIVSGGLKYTAIASSFGIVQSFSITVVNKSPLSDFDVMSVLEYLPPSSLKKCSVVNRKWRCMVNEFPPTMFYDTQRRSYPDYCIAADFIQNPYVVPDHEGAQWRIAHDGSMLDREEFTVVDASNCRVFLIDVDLNARSMEIEFYYASRRNPAGSLVENWVPFSNGGGIEGS